MDRPTGNLLLDALEPAARAALLARSRNLEFAADRHFAKPRQRIDEVLFPTSGTLSMLTPTDHDQFIESATIGREGMAGALVPLGIRETGQELIGQVPGSVISVDAEVVENLWKEDGRLSAIVNGYIAFQLSQTAVAVACNTVHHTTPRTARWLLMTHDRVESDTFELRQEFLAAMLGVQRPTVSISAGALQQAGLITYRRGRITVLDREGLESASCPCYEQIRTEYSRLVPL